MEPHWARLQWYSRNTMNRFFVRSVLGLTVLLTVAGCSKQEVVSETASRPQQTPPAGQPVASRPPTEAQGLESPGAATLTEIKALLAPISATTPMDDPAVNYIRENIDALFARRVLNNFSIVPEALKNPEIVRLLHEQYTKERAQGRFWSAGALMLANAANKNFAPEFWEDWKEMPSYNRPEVMGWLQYQEESLLPKSVLAHAIFELENLEVIDSVWTEFPALPAGDQLLIAKAASQAARPLVATQLLALVDRAKSDFVRDGMVHSANVIVYQRLAGLSGVERSDVLQNLGTTLSEMERRGFVRDFLAKEIRREAK